LDNINITVTRESKHKFKSIFEKYESHRIGVTFFVLLNLRK